MVYFEIKKCVCVSTCALCLLLFGVKIANSDELASCEYIETIIKNKNKKQFFNQINAEDIDHTLAFKCLYDAVRREENDTSVKREELIKINEDEKTARKRLRLSETYIAPIYGQNDLIVAIPQVSEHSAIEYADIDSLKTPKQGDILDMSGADGTLRGCYANQGIAKQLESFEYICNYSGDNPRVVTSELSPDNALHRLITNCANWGKVVYREESGNFVCDVSNVD